MLYVKGVLGCIRAFVVLVVSIVLHRDLFVTVDNHWRGVPLEHFQVSPFRNGVPVRGICNWKSTDGVLAHSELLRQRWLTCSALLVS